jgi:hypothetical protein
MLPIVRIVEALVHYRWLVRRAANNKLNCSLVQSKASSSIITGRGTTTVHEKLLTRHVTITKKGEC